jgi:hypothetical protein
MSCLVVERAAVLEVDEATFVVAVVTIELL